MPIVQRLLREYPLAMAEFKARVQARAFLYGVVVGSVVCCLWRSLQ